MRGFQRWGAPVVWCLDPRVSRCSVMLDRVDGAHSQPLHVGALLLQWHFLTPSGWQRVTISLFSELKGNLGERAFILCGMERRNLQ